MLNDVHYSSTVVKLELIKIAFDLKLHNSNLPNYDAIYEVFKMMDVMEKVLALRQLVPPGEAMGALGEIILPPQTQCPSRQSVGSRRRGQNTFRHFIKKAHHRS